MTVTIERISENNFTLHSLDKFERRQEVTQSLRKINGEWTAVSNVYTEDWDAEKLRSVASELLSSSRAFGAFYESEPIGFVMLGEELFGSHKQYIELKLIQVSRPFRRDGIGKLLLDAAVSEAKAVGAKKLYISAHSSAESQAFYRAVGCVEAAEPDKTLSEDEPWDVQMELPL